MKAELVVELTSQRGWWLTVPLVQAVAVGHRSAVTSCLLLLLLHE